MYIHMVLYTCDFFFSSIVAVFIWFIYFCAFMYSFASARFLCFPAKTKQCLFHFSRYAHENTHLRIENLFKTLYFFSLFLQVYNGYLSHFWTINIMTAEAIFFNITNNTIFRSQVSSKSKNSFFPEQKEKKKPTTR